MMGQPINRPETLAIGSAVKLITIDAISIAREVNKITITKNKYSGAITVSDIINNQLIEKTFYYYTIAECKKIFKREYK